MAKYEDPPGWADATAEEIAEAVNGCGPTGASHLVPDVVAGAPFFEACNRHDLAYHRGELRQSEADAQFQRNLRVAADEAPWYLRPFARIAARLYFRAVRFGGSFFFDKREG